jgi:hypothetical protein
VLKKILIATALVVLVAAAYAVHEIGFANIMGMLRYDQRREGALRVGDKAPDVVLGTLDGEGSVRLLDALRARPLVLVFGSYT